MLCRTRGRACQRAWQFPEDNARVVQWSARRLKSDNWDNQGRDENTSEFDDASSGEQDPESSIYCSKQALDSRTQDLQWESQS